MMEGELEGSFASEREDKFMKNDEGVALVT